MRCDRIEARRLASNLKKIFALQLDSWIGRQLAMFDGERSGLGIRVRNVLRQEGGGDCPKRIELNKERRESAMSSKKVLYHS